MTITTNPITLVLPVHMFVISGNVSMMLAPQCAAHTDCAHLRGAAYLRISPTWTEPHF